MKAETVPIAAVGAGSCVTEERRLTALGSMSAPVTRLFWNVSSGGGADDRPCQRPMKEVAHQDKISILAEAIDNQVPTAQ